MMTIIIILLLSVIFAKLRRLYQSKKLRTLLKTNNQTSIHVTGQPQYYHFNSFNMIESAADDQHNSSNSGNEMIAQSRQEVFQGIPVSSQSDQFNQRNADMEVYGFNPQYNDNITNEDIVD
eukprot:403354348